MTQAPWRTGAVALLCFLPSPLRAQSTLELRPAAYTIPAGRPIGLQLLSGDRPRPWPAASWLFVRGEGTQENLDAPPPADAAGQISLPAPGPGAAVAGIDFAPETATLSAKALRDFITSKAANPVAIDPAKPELSVAWHRSCTTLLRITAPQGAAATAGPSATIVGKLGQAAEIRPLMDPTTALLGSDIPFRAYSGGDKLAGIRILATPRATGTPHVLRTDASGIANLRITHAGAWTLEFHHIAVSAGTDFIVTSSTLTFEVPAPPPGPAAEPANARGGRP